jgi:hypothetical protein
MRRGVRWWLGAVVKGVGYRESIYSGFRRLAGYIPRPPDGQEVIEAREAELAEGPFRRNEVLVTLADAESPLQ